MSNVDTFATDFYGQLAKVVKALGNKMRLEILVLLAQGERTVDSISKEIQQPVTNISHNLKDLREIGAVATRKQGVNVFYSLADDAVYDVVVSLCEIAEKRSSKFQEVVSTYLDSRDQQESLDSKQLAKQLSEGDVTILDVRPPEEYKAGHLKGAINLQLNEIDKYFSELPEKKEVVAYCRGPYCILAYEAVVKLREMGYTAHRLKDGFPDWKNQGYPIDVNS
tara:strand:- start:57 stop:725 length:669 start_codon:yes stop_codon:yes gene_type:complete